MKMIVDVSRFPPEHQEQIRDLYENIQVAHESHDAAFQQLILWHSTRKSKIIEKRSQDVVEYYVALLDTINSYSDYLTKHDLMKYIKNG